jgi:hypothetical protein
MDVYPATVIAAAAAGNTEILQKCLSITTCPTFKHFHDNAVVAAARHGHEHALELLLQAGNWRGRYSEYTAEYFNDDCVSDVAICDGLNKEFEVAAEDDPLFKGSLHWSVMQVLQAEFPWITLHFNCIENFFELTCPVETYRLPPVDHAYPTFGFPSHESADHYSRSCAAAAEGGHINVHRQLVDHCVFHWDTPVIAAAAARNGHLAFLKYFVDGNLKNVRLNFWVSCAAARGGHVNVLQWLLKRFDTGKARTADQLIVEHHTPLAAAIGGHLAVLQWAVSENIQWWPRKTLILARLHDHIDVVQFILDLLQARAMLPKATTLTPHSIATKRQRVGTHRHNMNV